MDGNRQWWTVALSRARTWSALESSSTGKVINDRIVFTKKIIEALPTPETGRAYAKDSKVPGLLLQVNPTAVLKRSWFRIDWRRTLIKPYELRPWWQAVENLQNRIAAELAYHLVQALRYPLNQQGIQLSWDRIRDILSTQPRITLILPTDNDKTIHLRTTTQAEVVTRCQSVVAIGRAKTLFPSVIFPARKTQPVQKVLHRNVRLFRPMQHEFHHRIAQLCLDPPAIQLTLPSFFYTEHTLP